MNNKKTDYKKEGKEISSELKEFKYKLYIFFIALLIYLFWVYILSDSLQEVNSLDNKKASLEKEQKNIEKEISKVNSEMSIISNAEENKGNIINCINNDSCDNIKKSINNKLDLIKSYFLLNDLDSKKMDYDQKLILQNIYKFLLSHNKGNINIISFGGLSVEDHKKGIYKLPISLNVDFPSKKSLMTFLKKVENKVYKSLPVYYKIDSVNYNIMNYENKQSVSISMSAYFFKF